MTFTLDEQIAEVRRELEMREQTYPRWVQSQKMTGSRAERQIECMKAVLHTLQHMRGMADDGK
jgi:hypothetical protein